jgi:flagellar basal body-associated protein FliL
MSDPASTPDDKAPEAAADAKPAAPSGGGLKSILISSTIMAVVLGGIGFALAYFVLPGRLAAAAPATTVATTGTNATANPSIPVPASGTEKTERSAAEIAATGGKVVTKFTIEEVTVNIADTRGNRFVRAGVYFEASQPVLEELEANRARMVDTLGQVLSTKTLDDLTSPSIRGNLREELLGIINPTLKEGHIDNIYFTDLLVQ